MTTTSYYVLADEYQCPEWMRKWIESSSLLQGIEEITPDLGFLEAITSSRNICCLLMRPLDPWEARRLRETGISRVKLYCGVSMRSGFPLRIPPSSLAGKTVLERLIDYFTIQSPTPNKDRGPAENRASIDNILLQCVAWRDGWRGLAEHGVNRGSGEKHLKVAQVTSLPYKAENDSRLQLTELDLELGQRDPSTPTVIAPHFESQKSTELIPRHPPHPLLVFHQKSTARATESKPTRLARENIGAIELVAPLRLKEWCLDLLANPDYCQHHRMHFSHGDHLLRLVIEPDTPCHLPELDRLVSELFEVLLGASRPLRYYTTTIYLPVPDSDRHSGLELKNPENDNQLSPVKSEPDLTSAIKELDNKRPQVDKDAATAQSMLYFSPAVRNQVFENKQETQDNQPAPIQHYRYDQCDWKLRIDLQGLQSNGLPDCLEADITDLSLYKHPSDMSILAVTVELRAAKENLSVSWRLTDEEDASQPWWSDLLDSARWEAARESQLDAWLAFTRAARYLYRSFREESNKAVHEKPKILPVSLIAQDTKKERNKSHGFFSSNDGHETFNAPMFWLLAKFLRPKKADSSDTLEEKKLFDHFSGEFESDRLYVNAAYALVGPAPSSPLTREQTKRLFSLALYVDTGFDSFSSAGGYAYDPAFLDERLKKNAYGRWEAAGTWIGHTDNASVYLGFGDHFVKPIASLHVPWIYSRFILLALFHHHILRHLQRRAQRLPVDTQGDWEKIKRLKSKLKKLRQDFIDFTNLYWIHFPTEQIQGKEMYARLSEALSLKETHALAQQQIEQAEAFASQEHRDILEDIVRKLGYVTFFISLMGVIFAVLHSNEALAFLKPLFNQLIGSRLGRVSAQELHLIRISLEMAFAAILPIPAIWLLGRVEKLKIIARPALRIASCLSAITLFIIIAAHSLFLGTGLVK